MAIRIHEPDGVPYEHVLDIKEPFKRYELPCNFKSRKLKRTSRRYTSSSATTDIIEASVDKFTYQPWERSQEERDRWKVEDWTEEEDGLMAQSSVEWIRLDVDVEWICEFQLEMKEFMWLEQLQRDRDVVAQLEAVRALKNLPSKIVCSHLCRAVLVSEYFFRIRVEAVLALVSCATTRCGFLGLFHLLKLFQTFYCYRPQVESDTPWKIRAIPQPNEFDDFVEYFIRKALVVAISQVRNHNGNSPSICQQFFIDQLVYNDNTSNSYSDAHYIATTITAMADCFIDLADDGERQELGILSGFKLVASEINSDSQKSFDKKLLRMANELERWFMADRLVASYRNVIGMAVLEAKFKLMFAGLMPVDLMFFLLCTRPGNYLPLRILAFDCLLLLRGFQEKAIIRYMFIVMRDDPSLLVRRRLAMGLVQCLPILVLIEELDLQPSDHGLSVIEGPREPNSLNKFDHKIVTKHLRVEVGRALILRECIMSVMLHPHVDTDVQTCLLKLSEVLFKPSNESVPIGLLEEKPSIAPSSTPTLPKIRIPASSAAVEPQVAQAPLPKIILKDNQHHPSNDPDNTVSLTPAPPAPTPEVPSQLAAALIRKPRAPPKPKKFQASGMTIPDHRMCQSLLKKLVNQPLSQPFLKPVDPIRENAPNYFNVISHPMDFKTMGTKLDMGQYPNREAFKDDVNLIFSNCKTYNQPESSLVVKYAEPLKEIFEKLWERSEKTMSAIQAKGLGGVNSAWLQPTDTKLLIPPNNTVPLAPPPSFAAFAAGGSMIPTTSSSPMSPGMPLVAPSRISPEASRPGGLKVKLKPRTSISTAGATSELVPSINPSIPYPPRSALKIKFSSSTSSAFNPTNLPSNPHSTRPEGEVPVGYPAPPFTNSTPTSLTFPMPALTTAPVGPQNSRPPSLPSFVPPPPPPPSFESFSLASELSVKTTSQAIRSEKASSGSEPHILSPAAYSKSNHAKKRSSSSLTAAIDTPPPSSGSTQPAKRKHLIVQLPKPPSLASSAAPPIRPIPTGPGSSLGPNFPAPPPPSLPELGLPPHPLPSSAASGSIASSLKPPSNAASVSNPTKIKVSRVARRPVTPKPPEISMPPTLPISSLTETRVDHDVKPTYKSLGTSHVVLSSARVSREGSLSNPPEPLTAISTLPLRQVSSPAKKTKSKKSTLHDSIDSNPGYRPSPHVLTTTSEKSLSRSPSHISPSPSTSVAASTSTSLIQPISSAVVSESTENGSSVVDDLLVPKKAKAILRKMSEHPQGAWFRAPVDPIAVGAPTYLDEIKNPMDLSTMQKKLDKGVYKRRAELMADFNLVVSNCIQFNGAQSFLGLEAQGLKKAWLAEWEKAAKMSYTDKRSLLGLFNKLNQVPGVDVFSEPVDPVKYQIPTYFAVIGGEQNARDLGTIKANLVADRYNNIAEFEADVRLMFTNCFKFNAPNTQVEIIGRDLEKVFNTVMTKIRKDAGLPPIGGTTSAGNKRKGLEAGAVSKRTKVG